MTVQVRVWRNTGLGAGTDFDTSLFRGQSLLNQVLLTDQIGHPPSPPQPIWTLQPFTVALVPEPTSLAFVGFGAVALVLARRRS